MENNPCLLKMKPEVLKSLLKFLIKFKVSSLEVSGPQYNKQSCFTHPHTTYFLLIHFSLRLKPQMRHISWLYSYWLTQPMTQTLISYVLSAGSSVSEFPNLFSHIFLVYIFYTIPDKYSSSLMYFEYLSYQWLSIGLELIFPHYPNCLIIAPKKFRLIHVEFVYCQRDVRFLPRAHHLCPSSPGWVATVEVVWF